jgi:hypothetical protein
VATTHTLARMGAELSSVYAQEGTMKVVFARCLKKTDVQVCTFFSVLNIYCSVMQIIALLILRTYYNQQSMSLPRVQVVSV